jgi:hypothetical protein
MNIGKEIREIEFDDPATVPAPVEPAVTPAEEPAVVPVEEPVGV